MCHVPATIFSHNVDMNNKGILSFLLLFIIYNFGIIRKMGLAHVSNDILTVSSPPVPFKKFWNVLILTSNF